MSKLQKVLLILAANKTESKKDELIVNLCREFGEICQAKDIDVDWIDLYNDSEKDEFDPIGLLHNKDAKIVEYQFRIKRADCLVFFYPTRWNGLPAILKGFLDQVFSNGFAYRTDKKTLEGLLTDKNAFALNFSDQAVWQNKFYYNNTLEIFWTRGIFEVCGMHGKYINLGGMSNFSESKIEKIRKTTLQIAKNFNTKESWLDLF